MLSVAQGLFVRGIQKPDESISTTRGWVKKRSPEPDPLSTFAV